MSSRFSATFVLVLALITLLPALPSRADAPVALDSEELQFFTLFNLYRLRNGLEPVVLLDSLNRSARAHSRAMAETDCYAHHCPGEPSPRARFILHGYPAQRALISENLAAGSHIRTADAVLLAWHFSPAHNFNMLQKAIRAIGVGRYYDPDSAYQWYWTLELGSALETGDADPPASPPAPQIITESLPAARQAVWYNTAITAQKGRPPYSWTITGLPAGLQYREYGRGDRSAQIYDRADVSGTFTISATVTDARGQSETKSFTLTVNPCCNATRGRSLPLALLPDAATQSVDFEVYDLTGRRVAPTDGLSNGMYFYIVAYYDAVAGSVRRLLLPAAQLR